LAVLEQNVTESYGDECMAEKEVGGRRNKPPSLSKGNGREGFLGEVA
jgi:hypothetical protein